MQILNKDGDLEDRVLINRTRIKAENWKKLNLLAKILEEKHKDVITREMLIDQAIDGLIRYYDKKLNL